MKLEPELRQDLQALVDRYGYEDVLCGLGTLLEEEAYSLRSPKLALQLNISMVIGLVERAAEKCRAAAMDYYVSTK